MKPFTSYSLTLSLLILISCGGKQQESSRQDAALAVTDSVAQPRALSKDLSSMRFSSEEDVREFLRFSAFTSSDGGRIAFASGGGTLDSEPFEIEGIKVVAPAEAEIAVIVPKMGLDGNFTLKLADGTATVEDKKSKKIYKLTED